MIRQLLWFMGWANGLEICDSMRKSKMKHKTTKT